MMAYDTINYTLGTHNPQHTLMIKVDIEVNILDNIITLGLFHSIHVRPQLENPDISDLETTKMIPKFTTLRLSHN